MAEKITRKIEALPEHIRQAIDLLTALIKRFEAGKLDISKHKSLYMNQIERSYT